MRCARPSTTAVLPTPGSPTSTGLFLVRRERICMIRSISVSRPTTGSSLPSAASLVRLRPNWSSSLEDFLPSPAAAPDAAPAGPGEHADDLVADLLGVGVEVEQDARGDTLVLADEAEQDVLGADVVVAEAQGLAERQLQDLLRSRRERDLAGRDLLTGADDPHDLRADALDGDVQRLEHSRREALLLAEQAEQDVLGADVVVLESAGLLLGEDDDLTGSLCESLEQALLYLFKSRGRKRTGCPNQLLRLSGADGIRTSGLSRTADGKYRGRLARSRHGCRGEIPGLCEIGSPGDEGRHLHEVWLPVGPAAHAWDLFQRQHRCDGERRLVDPATVELRDLPLHRLRLLGELPHRHGDAAAHRGRRGRLGAA